MTLIDNPLLSDWSGPFGLPPFDRIRAEHFAPALHEAMRRHRDELDALAAQSAPVNFDNTAAALDRSGELLYRLDALLGNLTASHTSPELQAVQRALAGPMAAHDTAVRTHPGVFARLDQLQAQREQPGLSPEQRRLVERLHTDALRAGARFAPAQREAYQALVAELAELNARFGQNVLADENGHGLSLTGEADLAGLPGDFREACRQAALDRGLPEGSRLVTLSRSMVVPFLTFSERRDLRERIWRAWVARGEHAGEHDNRPLAARILQLRQRQAAMHGQASFADHALTDAMAGHQGAVRELLEEVWGRARSAFDGERALVEDCMRQHGAGHELQAWDWRFWAEKVRGERYVLDEAAVKPYLSLDRLVEAMFDCAQRLFGVHFERRADIAGYHPDVVAWEMFDAAGQSRGLFLQDNFARPTKRSGAWMSDFQYGSHNRGALRPVILNNCNFSRAAPGEPTLLSLDDARTLFHEFGHGLHGLLSVTGYHRLAGTQVLRDFVELPSQLYEHWLMEPGVLQRHARHWQTGEPIPKALVDKLQAAERWCQAYETLRYSASALVDLEAHAAAEPPTDISAFEAQVCQRIGLPEVVGMNHRLCHFQHLFAGGGYAAGYYVYLWAEVLDADAFNAFVEAGDPFDPQVAQRLLRHVYAAGDSVAPQQTYIDFRGRPAGIEPLLAQRGLLEPASA
ncbi:M3 family metallopeptidase [Ideonella sp. 4Y11]|uniref:M3 family metallopeptidase n=1 Tax=Ideonella aquatica TaxID=2824119 RepID=A0A940YQB9_9BURK|nr:M3 family metallopeptidase [Ideonella aquatica]MBQ0957520.1 M3 family metallopeptidase [Ideonella aquatica]